MEDGASQQPEIEPAEEEVIEVSTAVEVETLSRGRYWHERRSLLRFYGMPLLGVVVILFALWQLYGVGSEALIDRLALAVGLVLLFRRWIQGWMFKQRLRQIPGYGEMMHWRLSESGFHQKIQEDEATGKWENLYETVTTPEGFLLYPQKNLFYWIPREDFASVEDAERLEQILQEKADHQTASK